MKEPLKPRFKIKLKRNNFFILIIIILAIIFTVNYLNLNLIHLKSTVSIFNYYDSKYKNENNFIILNSLNNKNGDVKCDKIFLNMYNFHSTVGAKRPNEQYPSFDYKNMSLAHVDIRKSWLLFHEYDHMVKSKLDNQKLAVKNQDISDIVQLIKNKKEYNSYEDNNLNLMLSKHVNANELENKNLAVMGLYETGYYPWIEAVVLNLNKNAKINLIDYQAKEYENSNINWIHLTEYLKNNHESNEYDEFDVIISYYTLDKVGLGRYGEEFYLNSDLNTIKQYNCMMKQDGILFLTFSISKENDAYIEYNSHRVFDLDKMKSILSKSWAILDEKVFNLGSDVILVLKKI